MNLKISVCDKKKALLKWYFTNRVPFPFTVDFSLVLPGSMFLMTFHASIFLNIKLEPTKTLSPRRLSGGLHQLAIGSSYDQIQCFWLVEVPYFTNTMIEYKFNMHTIPHMHNGSYAHMF